MTDFPLDDATLVMLAEACRINEDMGRTTLQDFLRMGSAVKRELPECYCGQTDFCETPADCHFEDGERSAITFVEHEPGREPFSEHQVILVLVAEVQRLRAEVSA